MSVLTDKQTNRLYIKFCYQGKVYKKRLPKNITKKEAEKLETKFKNDLFFEAQGIEPVKNVLFEDFLRGYFLPFAIDYYTPKGYKEVIRICKSSLKFLKGKNLRSIRSLDIEKFKIFRQNLKTQHNTQRKPATVSRELDVISKIFSFAIKNEFIEFNPCSRVERPIFDNVQDRVLTDEEETLILNNIKSDWGKDIVLLILNTGLRQNDALGLTKFSVDWNKKTIRLIQGKTRRKVEIPINQTVYEILAKRRHNNSDYFFPSPRTGKLATSIKRCLEFACSRAGIEKIGSRVLRRTFATRISELNYNPSVVAKLLGHSDLRSVTRYNRELTILRGATDSLEKANRSKNEPIPDEDNFLKLVSNE